MFFSIRVLEFSGTVNTRSQPNLLQKTHIITSLPGLITNNTLQLTHVCFNAMMHFVWLMTRRDGCLKRGRETNVSFQRAWNKETFILVQSNIHPTCVTKYYWQLIVGPWRSSSDAGIAVVSIVYIYYLIYLLKLHVIISCMPTVWVWFLFPSQEAPGGDCSDTTGVFCQS